MLLASAAALVTTTVTFAASCDVAGPQAPRDLEALGGHNPVKFDLAGPPSAMNLCNIHFHKNAEHKGPGFRRSAGSGEHGGFACEVVSPLHAQMGHGEGPAGEKACHNVTAGDTIEVHWVFTSCNVQPGPGLGSCLSEACSNPQLRVEAAVFEVTDDGHGLDFGNFDVGPGRRQPASLPVSPAATLYRGSTTGPSYSGTVCSPFQVTWNVRHGCQAIDLTSLNEWCDDNVFGEDHAHGVRELVTDSDLLAPIDR